MNIEVFEDELLDAKIAAELLGEAPIGFELIIIQSATVLPFIGVIAAMVFLMIYTVPKPKGQADGSTTAAERMWIRICGPTHRWLHGGGLIPTLLWPPESSKGRRDVQYAVNTVNSVFYSSIPIN